MSVYSEKTGILVGAAPLGAEEKSILGFLKENPCVTVAADGGLSFFVKNKIAPDYWIGDADSLDEAVLSEAKNLFPNLDLTPCNPEKDDTDMRLGLLYLKEAGAKNVFIFGGLGGERMDHTFANVSLIYEFATLGLSCYLVSEREYMYVLLAHQEVTYPDTCEGKISVFSLSEETKLSIKGLFYEYDGVLTNRMG